MQAACSFGPESEYVNLAADIMRMLAEPTRIRIILTLEKRGELPVGELAESIAKKQNTVSQHLAKLRISQIVGTRSEGTKVFYRLLNEHAVKLVTQAVFQAEHAQTEKPRHHQIAMKKK